MAEKLSGLIIEQAETIAAIARSLVNFKKLSKSNATPPKMRGRLDALEKLWDSCRALHVRIIQASPEDRRTLSYFLNEEFLNAEDAYHEAADHINEAVSKVTSPSAAVTAKSYDSSGREFSAASSSQLSRIVIPKFTGKFTEWENFKGLFESLVDSNENLSNTQKFHYLKTSVAGDAAQLICNIQISDSNYDAAWKLLTGEYDDKFAIMHAHIHAIAEIPNMRGENPIELKKLRDTVSSSLAALKGLGRPVDSWDDLLVYLVSQKFSSTTKHEWNLKRGSLDDLPTYSTLHDFLTTRIRGLTDFATPLNSVPATSRPAKSRGSVNTMTVSKCVDCTENHALFKCGAFAQRSLEQRFEVVKQHKLCHNCLRKGHYTGTCPSKGRCIHCKRAHHSLLHRDASVPSIGQSATGATPLNQARSEPSASGSAPSAVTAVAVQSVQSQAPVPLNVLLATAWVILRTSEGRSIRVRALLDQGSTCSFISESLCQTLRTRRQRTHLQVHCFGEKYSGAARSRVQITLSPCAEPGRSFPLTAYSFQKITSYASSKLTAVSSWPHLRELPLADPDPSSRHPIHLLIGADLYGSILLGEIRQGPLGTPTAQRTAFGWILSGPTGSSEQGLESADTHNCIATDNLESLLQRFWDDESIPNCALSLTEEERSCERHFVESHQRDAQGRYIVRLPFKTGLPRDIGESYHIALLLYKKMEQRLQRRPEIARQYHAFLKEYESLHHMEMAVADASSSNTAVYIPHHAVLRDGSSTTKFRVVFNASCRTSNGTTLNDHLHIGPKLQQDLSAVILRWRQFQYVYTADVAKMYRQILVHPDDVDYQRILWQPANDAGLRPYRLLTVTYGTACAPYLAMRVLKQLVSDEGHRFPLAVPVVENSFYVDDALFGADDIDHLHQIRHQLVALMNCGQFELRKWTANAGSLLRDIPPAHRDQSDIAFSVDNSLKVLGLSWTPADDTFHFRVSPPESAAVSKRGILSLVARLFDPLGWVAPVVIAAKIILQELWLVKGGWDDPIPDTLRARWLRYCTELSSIECVRVPRWTGFSPTASRVELHGFADASNRAYAAVIYLRVVRSPADIRVHLIAAKTKVAPLKTVSIPRLELNAVVLLSRLLKWGQDELQLPNTPTYGWTDSTVTLAWITQHPTKWRTYVANRVSEVQSSLPTTRWNHVPSADNPADCASRGLSASELASFTLWWSGPPWLLQPDSFWPTRREPSQASVGEALAEARASALQVCATAGWDLSHQFSSWTMLIRVTAHVRRFVTNLRSRLQSESTTSGGLTLTELRCAERFWISAIQTERFDSERRALRSRTPIPNSSCLRALNPILGKDRLIRVGGRLEHAPLSYGERHPIILPDHHVTRLLIDKAHRSTLHGGTQLTLRTLRQQFWIISARSVVKRHIRQCVTCVRHHAQAENQQMGDLPAARVTPSSPFTVVGVDYAGPINLLAHVARGQRTTKHYVALFICFATRAIHLECVDDYATAGFLAAFHRFVSRRGLPAHVYSDNGTNFQGADRELQRALRALTRDSHLAKLLASDSVNWHFIPPAAPHFGGLWEAGVKSLKFHLKRAVGAHTLSRAEFTTLLCKIEACLNSRPLSPLSADPTDLAALTPGHFLIGKPLVSVPEESVLDLNEGRLDRWQLVRRMQEQIWRHWSHDYLHSLQQRQKWEKTRPCVSINELVLIKSNLLPPAKWLMARIIKTHPGEDGLTRVVTLRTADGELKRPITQICRLPIPREDPMGSPC